VSRSLARTLGLGVQRGVDAAIRPFMNGRDVNQRPRDVMVIDLFGLTEKSTDVALALRSLN
jgi:hypothetical protein